MYVLVLQYLPDDGITVFGSYLHSHLIGEYKVVYWKKYIVIVHAIGQIIKVYYFNMLFTTGTGLTVKHFRNTSSSQCNAVEELKPIDQNLNYDFDFQVMHECDR